MLGYLYSRSEPVDVPDLVDAVAAKEYDMEPEELTEKQRKRIYVSLYQTHIPKLDNLSVITYDEEAGVVKLTDRATAIKRHLSSIQQQGRDWQVYYLILAAGGAVVLVADILSVPPFELISGTLVGLVLVAGFGLLALAHHVLQSRARDRFCRTILDAH